MIREIQARVRAATPQGSAGSVALADLSGVLHARDAAQGKVAAIGSVNPRPPGGLNGIIQSVKRLIARSLNWLLRDQVDYNRALLRCIDELLESLNQTNRALQELAADKASPRIGEVVAHWNAWRPDWERKLAAMETQNLRAVAELQAAYQHRLTVLESSLRERAAADAQHLAALDGERWKARSVREQAAMDEMRASQEERLQEWESVLRQRAVADADGLAQQVRDAADAFAAETLAHRNAFEEQLAKAVTEVQQRLWEDIARVRNDYQQMIHHELRLIRQRASAPASTAVETARDQAAGFSTIDWMHFSRRFRGPEDYVRASFERYMGRFAGCQDVADLGCGRGEFLDLARQHSIGAVGVETDAAMAEYCRERGHRIEQVNLFDYLRALPDGALDGIFCAHVIEHLPPGLLPELITLCARKLRPGKWCVFETPNPECLAIFATHFYIDPTHVRPVPPALMAFYLEEAGFAPVEVTRLRPADETLPALDKIPAEFRHQFFGELDYVISGRKER